LCGPSVPGDGHLHEGEPVRLMLLTVDDLERLRLRRVRPFERCPDADLVPVGPDDVLPLDDHDFEPLTDDEFDAILPPWR